MFSRILAPISLVAATTLTAAAATRDCPTLDGDKILELLDQAPTCERSLALFEVCSYGASGDVRLSAVVIRKCEADFLTRLSKPQRQAYDHRRQQCERKYQNQSGTMYRSFEAFCSAKLARDYAQRFAKGPKP
jgi:hypothetical protein